MAQSSIMGMTQEFSEERERILAREGRHPAEGGDRGRVSEIDHDRRSCGTSGDASWLARPSASRWITTTATPSTRATTLGALPRALLGALLGRPRSPAWC